MSQTPSHGAGPAQPATGNGRGRAAFACGLASFAIALLAALFASGLIPGRTSGEAMLLFVFVALPLAIAGLGLSFGSGRRGLRRVAVALALVALLAVLIALLVVYLSWSRCAPSCI